MHIHTIYLILVSFAISPVIGLIPLSALSGILLSVAVRLLNPKELKFLSKVHIRHLILNINTSQKQVSYQEVVPLATTFCTILASDLVTGVQVGVATALVMQAIKKQRPQLLSVSDNNNMMFKLEGDVSFISLHCYFYHFI
jgi:carbonic anhydrase